MRLTTILSWFGGAPKPDLDSKASNQPGPPQDAESQFNLGKRCDGEEASEHAKAAEWYLKAAAQGHRGAQFTLGICYAEGKGVVRDHAAADLWLRRAAELGHAEAQYQLGGRLYCASKGMRKAEGSEGRLEALKWWRLAEEQSHRGARSAIEYLLLAMTPEEVDEGRRRAVACAKNQ